MKKSLHYCLLAVLFFSCSSSTPEETAQQFIKALYRSDLTTAATLTTADSKSLLDKARKDVKTTLPPEEAFQLTTLSAAVSNEKAEVKNEIIVLPLVKEEGNWKVKLTPDLLDGIQRREEVLAGVKTAWETLLKEYEARNTIAREYINYKKGLGPLSPQAKALNGMLAGISPANTWTKETLQAYAQKQQSLMKAIDNALEPSLAANTDLTMNYFLQLSRAGDRIKAAEAAYQPLAETAHSPVYVSLPSATRQAVKR